MQTDKRKDQTDIRGFQEIIINKGQQPGRVCPQRVVSDVADGELVAGAEFGGCSESCHVVCTDQGTADGNRNNEGCQIEKLIFPDSVLLCQIQKGSGSSSAHDRNGCIGPTEYQQDKGYAGCCGTKSAWDALFHGKCMKEKQEKQQGKRHCPIDGNVVEVGADHDKWDQAGKK